MIMIPDLEPFGRDGVSVFHLGPKEGSDQFAGEIGGADVNPGILINLTAKELTAVGAFFSDDFSSISEGGVVDQDGTTFAGDDVLGFVERIAT